MTRLDRVEADLGAMFDMDIKTITISSSLQTGIASDSGRSIALMPDYLIEAAVGQIPKTLDRPTAEERKRLLEFLLKRRGYMFEHIKRWKHLFKGLP